MRAWGAGLACVVMALATASSAGAGTTVISKRGLYRVTVTPRPASSPVGRLHTWQLMLRTRSGSAMTKARIAVEGDMPEHGHGLPTQPRVRELGRGRYVVEGMKFQMGGFWYVRFTINAKRGRDVARVEFTLPE
jgi:hypothetical protein